jgi:hypothetical protein
MTFYSFWADKLCFLMRSGLKYGSAVPHAINGKYRTVLNIGEIVFLTPMLTKLNRHLGRW